MPESLKEPIKFSLFLILGLALVVLAGLFLPPVREGLRLQREAEAVRVMVPGATVKAPLPISDGQPAMWLYRAKPDVSVVFFRVDLFDRVAELVVRLDGDQIVDVRDASPGLAPYNARLGRTLRELGAGLKAKSVDGDAVAPNPGLDVVGGATVDYSRLSAGLNQLVKNVRKAGNN